MQSVEEAECRRAFDSAVGTYNSSFDHKKHIEEVGLLISELLDALIGIFWNLFCLIGVCRIL